MVIDIRYLTTVLVIKLQEDRLVGGFDRTRYKRRFEVEDWAVFYNLHQNIIECLV